MKQIQAGSTSQYTCAVCNEPLKWWNAQKCVDCGHIICERHAYTFKHNAYSSVLYTHCHYCGKQYLAASHLYTQHPVHAPVKQG